MRKIIFILLLLPCFLFGQNIDSLKLALKNATHDTTKLILRKDLGEATSVFRIGYWDTLAQDSKKINYKVVEAHALNNMGYLYNSEGNIPKGLEYYHKSLKIQEEIGDKKGIALSFNNIGGIYNDQGDVIKALEYWTKSLNIKEDIGDKLGVSQSLNNLGVVLYEKGDVKKALEYYQRALEITQEIDDKQGISYSLNNLGYLYGNEGKLDKALEYYQKSLKIYQEIEDKSGEAYGLNNISNLLIKLGNTSEALLFANQGMQVAKELGFPLDIKNSATTLKLIFQKQNKYKDAFEMFELETKMKDSINNEETQKAAVKKQMQYEYETQAKELKNEQDKKDIIAKAELVQREKERNYFVIGFALVIVLALFIFRSYRQKQKANLIITQQKHEVEESRKEILDSIHYAKRIQKAHLPTDKYIENAFERLKKKA